MVNCSKLPSYRRHKQSGQAIVTLADGFGRRRDVLLGRYGTVASKREYDRRILEWIGNGRRLKAAAASQLTISELMLAYWTHAKAYHAWGRNRGSSYCIKDALRILKQLYDKSKACEFGPIALKACRQVMLERDWSRGYINRQVNRICHVFKWAASEQLLPAAIHEQLATVEGLRRGKTTARETDRVLPVSMDQVEAAIAFMQPTVAAMVRFQLLTGCRPAEMCVLRPVDLDMKNPECWVYRPGSDQGEYGQHKTAHHGHDRLILIGPRCQDVLRPFLGTRLDAYCFSPALSETQRNTKRREQRRTPMTPSQARRRPKQSRKRAPRDSYDVNTYRKAIARACEAAYPAPGDLAQREGESKKNWAARLTVQQKAELREWQRNHSWAPNQLRHTRATELRPHGLDVAKTILGHTKIETTQIYAEKDLAAAMALVAKIG